MNSREIDLKQLIGKDPESSYLRYREDPNITYVSKTSGFCNIWIVVKERIDLEENVVFKGYRSDYYVPYAPNHSWKNAIEMMRKEIKSFNPDTLSPQHILESRFDETISWNIEDEILYSYFRCNLRNNIEPVMKEYKISGEKVYNKVIFNFQIKANNKYPPKKIVVRKGQII